MKDKVIGSGKPKGVNKSPWERRVRKMGQGNPRKANEPRMPKRKRMGHRSPQVIKNPMTILSH